MRRSSIRFYHGGVGVPSEKYIRLDGKAGEAPQSHQQSSTPVYGED